MRRSLALLLVAPLLAAALPAATFTGAWAGPWDDAEIGQSGTAAIVVDAGGGVSGSVFNTNGNVTGPVAGRIGPDGTAHLTYSYPDSGSYRADGTCTADPPGFTCLLEFTAAAGGRLGHGTFHFLPAATAPAAKG